MDLGMGKRTVASRLGWQTLETLCIGFVKFVRREQSLRDWDGSTTSTKFGLGTFQSIRSHQPNQSTHSNLLQHELCVHRRRSRWTVSYGLGASGQMGFFGSVVFAGRSRRACLYASHSLAFSLMYVLDVCT